MLGKTSSVDLGGVQRTLCLEKVDYLILALYSPNHAEEYVLDRNSQLQTWASRLNPNFRVLWIVGNPRINKTILKLDILEVPCEDSEMIQKSYLAFSYCLENFNFKYIIRTNTSTFFFMERLNSLLNKMSKLDVNFAGFPLGISLRSHFQSKVYCSGASIFLSQLAVRKLLDCREGYSGQPDDIEISRKVRNFFPAYYIFRSDLELFPIWRPRPVIRLKHPFNSYRTSVLMNQMGKYQNSTSCMQKIFLYCSLTFPLILEFMHYNIGPLQVIRRLSILIKSSIYIRISNIKFVIRKAFWD